MSHLQSASAGLAVLLLLAGCKESRPAPVGPPATARPSAPFADEADAGRAELRAAPEPRTVVKVWFLDRERMRTGEEPMFVPVERSVSAKEPIRGALEALFAGPVAVEADRLKLVTSEATGFSELRVEQGIAHVRLAGGCNSGGSTATIAREIMPTLKQFEEVQFVKIYDLSGETEQPEGRTDSIPFCLEP